MKYGKIAKLIMWALLLIGLVLLIVGSTSGFDGGSGIVDMFLRYAYLCAIIAVALVVILGIAIAVANNPKSLIKLLLGIIVAAAIVAVVYFTAAGNPALNVSQQPSQATLKLTDTLLNLTYLLGGCAILAILAGEVVKVTRNK
ncbi:MAG: hypothetical protein II151_01800 [Bacteroidales bacterium]|nr:hypothetical protein [Bacteroidales bacterium]MBQ4287431.1 hypothetical protein [Bacteroidales bacterium]